MDIDRLKKLRIYAGYTQRELAQKLRVSTSTVSMWEAGERDPSTKALSKLCDLLNCTSDYLLGKTVHPRQYIIKASVFTGLSQDEISDLMNTISESGLNAKDIKRAIKAHKALMSIYRN